jgi:hypothetical protein
VALGFLCINLVSLPFVYLIWQRSRRLWHTPVNVGESQRTAV